MVEYELHGNPRREALQISKLDILAGAAFMLKPMAFVKPGAGIISLSCCCRVCKKYFGINICLLSCTRIGGYAVKVLSIFPCIFKTGPLVSWYGEAKSVLHRKTLKHNGKG